ncbi:hypothetical protein CHN50_00340 [Priestia aryabhattai]|nr:hypothetical protein CHN50_00340 [Priestia aryabhattai]
MQVYPFRRRAVAKIDEICRNDGEVDKNKHFMPKIINIILKKWSKYFIIFLIFNTINLLNLKKGVEK